MDEQTDSGLIIPDGEQEEPEAEEKQWEPAAVDEDWNLLVELVAGIEREYADDTEDQKDLRVELALTRHVNQQKVMSYSRLNEVNPMEFVDPMTMLMIRLDVLADSLTPGLDERLCFELAYEQAVTEHIDGVGMRVTEMRTRALAPDQAQVKIGPDGQVQVSGGNRQQRRNEARKAAKLITKLK